MALRIPTVDLSCSPFILLFALAAHPAQADLAPSLEPVTNEPRSQIELEFDFYAGGLRVARVRGAAQLYDGRYTANAIFKSEGSLSDLFDVLFSFQSVGLRRAKSFDPQNFAATYKGLEGDPTITVTFSPLERKPLEVVPALPEDLVLADFAGAGELIDPISAVLEATVVASEAPCKRSFELFDGVRSYRLLLLKPEEDGVHSYRGSIYEGPAIRCRWRYELMTSSKRDWARDLFLGTPPEGKIWFADLKGVMTPVRLMAETPIVNVVMHIISARVNDESVARSENERASAPN